MIPLQYIEYKVGHCELSNNYCDLLKHVFIDSSVFIFFIKLGTCGVSVLTRVHHCLIHRTGDGRQVTMGQVTHLSGLHCSQQLIAVKNSFDVAAKRSAKNNVHVSVMVFNAQLCVHAMVNAHSYNCEGQNQRLT